MAIYRNVHVNFWEDSKVLDEMNIEERYFWLYLLTNPHTNQIGCFEISKRQIKNETDFDSQKINELLHKFENELQLIIYSAKTKEIFIKNWHKYNWNKSPKVRRCIEKEFFYIKDEKIKEKLYQMLIKVYGMDTISISYANGIYMVGIQEEEEEEEEKEKKEEREKKRENFTQGDFVAPTLSEIISYGSAIGANEKYCERFFNNYEGVGWVNANGIKIKNWKLVLNNWFKKDLEDGNVKDERKKDVDPRMVLEDENGKLYQQNLDGTRFYF